MGKTTLIIFALLATITSHAGGRFTDTTGLTAVDCSTINHGADTFVMLTAGQSNAANSTDSPYVPTQAVYMYFNGMCYEARDPLLGATGIGGSHWGILADKLILEGGYTNVIIGATAVSGSDIASWAPGLANFAYLVTVAYQMRTNHGLWVDAVLFQQGESDVLTTTQVYYDRLVAFIYGLRQYGGLYAPVYVAQTSYCFGVSSTGVLQAQAYATTTVWNTFLGPNTDTVGPAYRRDNCHFNGAGAARVADMWFDKLGG